MQLKKIKSESSHRRPIGRQLDFVDSDISAHLVRNVWIIKSKATLTNVKTAGEKSFPAKAQGVVVATITGGTKLLDLDCALPIPNDEQKHFSVSDLYNYGNTIRFTETDYVLRKRCHLVENGESGEGMFVFCF